MEGGRGDWEKEEGLEARDTVELGRTKGRDRDRKEWEGATGFVLEDKAEIWSISVCIHSDNSLRSYSDLETGEVGMGAGSGSGERKGFLRWRKEVRVGEDVGGLEWIQGEGGEGG